MHKSGAVRRETVPQRVTYWTLKNAPDISGPHVQKVSPINDRGAPWLGADPWADPPPSAYPK